MKQHNLLFNGLSFLFLLAGALIVSTVNNAAISTQIIIGLVFGSNIIVSIYSSLDPYKSRIRILSMSLVIGALIGFGLS